MAWMHPARDASIPKPRWARPGEVSRLQSRMISGVMVVDGPNLWEFTGGLAVESRDRRSAVKLEDGSNGLLVGYLADQNQPLLIPLELAYTDHASDQRAKHQVYGRGTFGEKVLRATPQGLILTRVGLPGFWLIPRADLERRIAEFRRAQPAADKVPQKR